VSDPGAEPLADPDLARSVLSHLRVASAARGGRSTGSSRRRRRGADRNGTRDRGSGPSGGYSGPGPDAADPHLAGEILAELIDEQGWSGPISDARVFAQWGRLVGADVAAHCTPQSLRDGELRIAAESTAWATQLRMLSHILLGRLATELGSGVVRRVSITGPVAPSWKHGGRSVRGARGPRDTYG
jgi:predicted nucleic acid-binding Zn ribbon protein